MGFPHGFPKLCLSLAARLAMAAALFTAFSQKAMSLTVATTQLTVTSNGKAVSQVTAGSIVTLTATVMAGNHPLTSGQVEFCDTSATLCTDVHLLARVYLNQTGSASTTFRPGIGIFTWRAVLLGSAGDAASESGPATLTVTGSLFAPTATTLASTGVQGNYSLLAQVKAYGTHPAPPGGTISLRDLSASLPGASSAVLGPALPGIELLRAPALETQTGIFGVVAADFNGDGRMDLAWTEFGMDQVQVALGVGDGTFTQVSNPPATGSGPVNIFTADFNGDGKPDLVTINIYDNSINILLGEGNGNFLHAPALHPGPNITSLVTGDFNEDGKEDIALTYPGAGIVLLSGKGDGTFVTVGALTDEPYPFSVLTADFNHDGHLDLVEFGSGDGLFLYLGKGDGTFRAPINQGLPNGSETGVAADFNRDGQLDLAYIEDGSYLIRILLGDGKGGFSLQPITLATGGFVQQVVTADFNGDGVPDLAVANGAQPDNLAVMQGNGDGTFLPPAFTIAGTDPAALAVADFNGDGLADLASGDLQSNSGLVDVLLTAVTETAIARAQVTPVGEGLHKIYVAYAATAGNGKSASKILYLAGVPATTTALALTSPSGPVSAVSAGTVITLTATVTGANSSVGAVQFCDAAATDCIGTHLLGSAQLTPKGIASLRFVPGIGAHSYKAAYQVNANGEGSESSVQPLTVEGSYASTTVLTTQDEGNNRYNLIATVTGHSGAGALVTGTVSFFNTSAEELLATLPLVPAAGIVSFTSGQAIATGRSPVHVVTADFNLDGSPDAAVLNSGEDSLTVLLGKGDGTFRSVSVPYTSGSPHGIVVGDFNGDGYPDLAVTNNESHTLTMLLGKGDGTFVSKASQLPGAGPYELVTADFNGDGFADLALTSRGDRVVYILGGAGNGTFGIPRGVNAGAGAYAITVNDFNADHVPDLAVVNSDDQTLSVLLNKGDGSFSSAVIPLGHEPQSIVSADFNGDGRPDLAITNSAGNNLSILLGNEDGSFLTLTGPTVGKGPYSLAFGDVNGDGKTDLAIINAADPSVTVLLGNGDGTFVLSNTVPVVGEPSSVALADLDGDGLPDLLVPDFAHSTVSVFHTKSQPQSQVVLANAGLSLLGGNLMQSVYNSEAPYLGSESALVELDQGRGPP